MFLLRSFLYYIHASIAIFELVRLLLLSDFGGFIDDKFVFILFLNFQQSSLLQILNLVHASWIFVTCCAFGTRLLVRAYWLLLSPHDIVTCHIGSDAWLGLHAQLAWFRLRLLMMKHTDIPPNSNEYVGIHHYVLFRNYLFDFRYFRFAEVAVTKFQYNIKLEIILITWLFSLVQRPFSVLGFDF